MTQSAQSERRQAHLRTVCTPSKPLWRCTHSCSGMPLMHPSLLHHHHGRTTEYYGVLGVACKNQCYQFKESSPRRVQLPTIQSTQSGAAPVELEIKFRERTSSSSPSHAMQRSRPSSCLHARLNWSIYRFTYHGCRHASQPLPPQENQQHR